MSNLHTLTFVALFMRSAAIYMVPDECAKGEYYWCSNIENAMKCSAFKHCAATVWKNDISNGDDHLDKCEVCTKFLTDVKLVVKDEPIRSAFKVILKEKICPLFDSYEKTCKMVIERYSDEILDFIASEIKPLEMCQFLHMCSKGLTKDLYLKNVTGGCEMCKFFITELKDYIGAHPTRKTIEEALEKLCQALPDKYKKVCDDFVAKYSDMIIDLILKNLDAQLICEELHLCPDVGCHGNTESIDKCEVCEIAFNFFEEILEKNSTVVEIEAAAHKVCQLVPCPYREYCNDIMDEYLPLVVKAFVNKMKPRDACIFLNLCNSSTHYYKCISGPKYWCASEANARLCEAEDHCRTYVWK